MAGLNKKNLPQLADAIHAAVTTMWAVYVVDWNVFFAALKVLVNNNKLNMRVFLL